MASVRLWHIVRLRLIYCCVAFIIIAVQLVPTRGYTAFGTAPDLLLCMTIAWTIRRPEVMSPIWVAIVLVLADFLLQRPPGLWALIVLGVNVVLARQVADLHKPLFMSEWLLATGAIIAVVVVYQIALLVTFLPTRAFLPYMLQTLLTILVYPLVTMVSHRLFGVAWDEGPDVRYGGGLS